MDALWFCCTRRTLVSSVFFHILSFLLPTHARLEAVGSGLPLGTVRCTPHMRLADLNARVASVKKCRNVWMAGHDGAVLETDAAVRAHRGNFVLLRQPVFEGKLVSPRERCPETTVAFAVHGRHVLVANLYQLKLWDATTGQLLWHVGEPVERADHRKPSFSSVALDDDTVAVGCQDELVQLRSLAEGFEYRRVYSNTSVSVSARNGRVENVALCARYAAGAIAGGRFVIWNRRSGQLLRQIPVPHRGYARDMGLHFLPTGDAVCFLTADATGHPVVAMEGVDSFDCKQVRLPHHVLAGASAFCGDSVVASSPGCMVQYKLCNEREDTRRFELPRALGAHRVVANKQRAAVAGADGTVAIVHLGTGHVVHGQVPQLVKNKVNKISVLLNVNALIYAKFNSVHVVCL